MTGVAIIEDPIEVAKIIEWANKQEKDTSSQTVFTQGGSRVLSVGPAASPGIRYFDGQNPAYYSQSSPAFPGMLAGAVGLAAKSVGMRGKPSFRQKIAKSPKSQFLSVTQAR